MSWKNKKIASIILFLAITSAALTGCAKPAETQKESSAPVSSASVDSKTEESTPESSVITAESTNESSVVETSEETNPYYSIQVGIYYVFYVVVGDVMEVRRLIYSRRYIENILP